MNKSFVKIIKIIQASYGARFRSDAVNFKYNLVNHQTNAIWLHSIISKLQEYQRCKSNLMKWLNRDYRVGKIPVDIQLFFRPLFKLSAWLSKLTT